MKDTEIIIAGFNYLHEDCSRVLLQGWELSENIPDKAKKEMITNEIFNHSFSDIKINEWDECEFWGNIYLPFGDGTYMNFEVSS